jgi:hypothetical protein
MQPTQKNFVQPSRLHASKCPIKLRSDQHPTNAILALLRFVLSAFMQYISRYACLWLSSSSLPVKPFVNRPASFTSNASKRSQIFSNNLFGIQLAMHNALMLATVLWSRCHSAQSDSACCFHSEIPWCLTPCYKDPQLFPARRSHCLGHIFSSPDSYIRLFVNL